MLTLYTIIATLPDPDKVIVLLSREKESKCKWSEKVRDYYMDVVKMVREGSSDPDSATLKVLPYYAKIRHNTGRIKTLHDRSSGVTILGPAGTPEEPFGLRITLIHKASGDIQWKNSFKTANSGCGYGDYNSLEVRSDRDFLRKVSEYPTPVAKDVKLVMVPGNENVRLTRNKSGEYVTQVAKVWS